MRYKVIKRRMEFSGAIKYLKDGFFIRRSCWPNGTVLFTKEDYKETEWQSGKFDKNIDVKELLKTRPQAVPQFWYMIGFFRFKNTPNDAWANDWEVVAIISMTDSEVKRTKGKIGGVVFYEEEANNRTK